MNRTKLNSYRRRTENKQVHEPPTIIFDFTEIVKTKLLNNCIAADNYTRSIREEEKWVTHLCSSLPPSMSAEFLLLPFRPLAFFCPDRLQIMYVSPEKKK